MDLLPEIKDGKIYVHKASLKPKKKRREKAGKKEWREYYKSIEFIKHL